jgi:membrane protein
MNNERIEPKLQRKHRTPWRIAARSVTTFLAGEPFQLAAALSYFSLLSLAPLLLVVTGIFGLMIDEAWFREQIVEQTRQLTGPAGADVLRDVIASTQDEEGGGFSLIMGIVLTFIGATTVFAQLQAALNRIFDVKAKARNAVTAFIRARLISFAVVVGVGFLMLVSLTISAVLSGLQRFAGQYVSDAGWIWQSINMIVAYGVLTVFIAMLFKFVPDVQLKWRDTWIGAATTAALFSVGKYVIGLYLGAASIGSTFGAAGSAVVFMVWIYYASLILFLGASITRVVAYRPKISEFAEPENGDPHQHDHADKQT